MEIDSKHIQRLYQAYCNTHLLWKNGAVYDLKQLQLPNETSLVFLRKLKRRLRLGQLAEQFAFNQMDAYESIQLLAENIQIQREKHTLGELDALLLIDNQPIHLEIIYKFYVYDASLGTSETDQWIGPNRKDSLKEKLTKLTKKQLPLLYSSDCQSALKLLGLNDYHFEQRVLFKAQLFVPYQQEIHFEQLNQDCVCGFYIHTKQLEHFKACEFYIPNKLDWFLEPQTDVDWLNYANFILDSHTFLEQQQSPLFWIKTENGTVSKGFLVWW
ncbi:DUF1853 family protein [Psychroserpens sp. SPM9]|uniref:DUF1853 family protein n=1 Tax=Psychroserpens sp. SPM9 TaxID=2975598 RepID=UPI0021A81D86|nr:DUF1853 family protein [Psychroserpens sp. SPM9]MDG5491563.1 DUF1853 family protein [Psychroserpens sp. SPM9]